MRIFRTFSLSLLPLLFFAPAAFATYAISVPGPDVWYVYHTFPGAQIEGEVVVQNFDKENPAHVELDAVDASDWNQYTFHLEPFGAEDNTIGAWVSLDQTNVDLGPGDSKKVNFTVNIPEDAEFGEYAGGLTVSEREVDASGGMFVVRTRSGIRMYITVEEAPDGVLAPPVGGDIQVLFTLGNTRLVRILLVIVGVGLLVSILFNVWYRRRMLEMVPAKKKKAASKKSKK